MHANVLVLFKLFSSSALTVLERSPSHSVFTGTRRHDAGGLATRQTENFCFACTGLGGDSGWYKSGSMYWAVGRLICFYFLTGGSYWPETNASELHFAGSFQGHPIWPYLARPILRQKCIFGQLALLFNFCRWVWPGTYDVTTRTPCYLKASWWIQGSKSSVNSHTYGVVGAPT